MKKLAANPKLYDLMLRDSSFDDSMFEYGVNDRVIVEDDYNDRRFEIEIIRQESKRDRFNKPYVKNYYRFVGKSHYYLSDRNYNCHKRIKYFNLERSEYRVGDRITFHNKDSKLGDYIIIEITEEKKIYPYGYRYFYKIVEIND